MAELATLGVHLEATGTEQVVAALGRVETAMKGTHQSTVSMGAAIGTASAAATAAFGVIAHAAQAALGGVSESLVGMNAKLEQSGIAFTTMLGSAEAAGAFLKDLQEFAAQTPFEFPQLVEASKRMLAFGFSAQQVRPMLTSIGDAAAGLSIGAAGIDRITTALGQMQMKGKVSAEEVNQLAEAGINAWDAIAKKLSIDVPTAMKMSEQGLISSAQAIPAILAGMNARFGGLMEAQSHTFAGAMSTIRDTLGQLVGGAFKPFFDVLSGLADRLAQFAQGETVSVWAQDLQITLGALAPLFSQVGAWLETQLPAAMSAAEAAAHGFVGAVQDLGPHLQELAQTVGPLLATAWERLTGGLSAAGTAFAALAPTLGTVYGAVQQLSDAVTAGLAAALGGLSGQLASLGTTLSDIGAGLTNALGGSQTGALDALAALAATLGAALSALGAAASEAFQTIQIAAVDAANVVIPKLEELATWLEGNLAPALATIQEAWDGFWSHAGPLVSAMWGVVGPILAQLAGFFAGELVLAVKGFQAVWDGVVGNLQAGLGFLAPILSQLGGVAAEVADKITAGLQLIQQPVAVAAEEVGTTIKNEIVKAVAPVGAEVAAATEPAAAAVAKVGTSASTAAPAVASLGGAGTTAAAGMTTATTAAKDLDGVMAQLAKATTPEAVQQALLYQNATAALSEALKSLDLETAAQVTAMKNAGDVYGAARTALTALGATEAEAAAAVHGLASAHDVLAEAAYRATAALRAAQSAGQGVAGISAAGAFAGPTNFGNIPTQGLSATAGPTTFPGATGPGGAAPSGAMATALAILARASGPQYARMATGEGRGFSATPPSSGELIEAYVRAHPEAEAAAAAAVAGNQTRLRALNAGQASGMSYINASVAASVAAQAEVTAELQRRAELEQNIIAGQQIAQKVQEEATRTQQAVTASMSTLPAANFQMSAAMQDANRAVYQMTTGTGLAARSISSMPGNIESWAMSINDILKAEQSYAQALQANAQALMTNTTVIAGMTIGQGLTYGQIYGNTGTQSGAGGGSTGVLPGNLYGLPIVSPLTKGSLYGFANGGMVMEPSYLTNARTGRTFGMMAERGPEPIGGGGNTYIIHAGVTVNGADALRDPRLYEQMLDRGLTQAMQKRRLI